MVKYLHLKNRHLDQSFLVGLVGPVDRVVLEVLVVRLALVPMVHQPKCEIMFMSENFVCELNPKYVILNDRMKKW